MTASAHVSSEAILALIQEELRAINAAASEELSAETEWREIDVDSIEVVELVSAVEDRYEIQASDDDFDELRTPGALVDLVLRRLRALA